MNFTALGQACCHNIFRHVTTGIGGGTVYFGRVFAGRCEIQVSYAIGVSEPTSISINTFDTNTLPEAEIANLVREHFDLRAGGLVAMLDLKRPIYQSTAAYGHFGREQDNFTWEKTDKIHALKAAL